MVWRASEDADTEQYAGSRKAERIDIEGNERRRSRASFGVTAALASATSRSERSMPLVGSDKLAFILHARPAGRSGYARLSRIPKQAGISVCRQGS